VMGCSRSVTRSPEKRPTRSAQFFLRSAQFFLRILSAYVCMQIRVADSQGCVSVNARGLARACLLRVSWSVPSGRPAKSSQRRQAFAQHHGDRDSGRARREFSRPPSGLTWPRGVSSFMTQRQRAPANTSPGVSLTSERGSETNARLVTSRENFAFSWPSSKIARMSSPGF
jgi:hypothetical protein